MAGRRLEALALTEVEKSELKALSARAKTAQALAGRARIVLACADGLENKAVGQQLDVHPKQAANGAAASWRSGSRDWATSHDPARRARLRTSASRR